MDDFNDPTTQELSNPTPPAAPRWKGARSRGLLCRLNERCMELLIDAAAANSPQTMLQALTENRKLWIRLDSQARERAAQMPFVIVDAQFNDDARWAGIAKGEPVPVLANGLPKEISEALMLEVLMFAWQLAHADKRTAMMSLGMSSTVADTIAALTPQAIRDIALRECASLQLRWSHDLQFWRDFLLAAKNGDEEKLSELFLQANLLLCSELARVKK